MVESKYISNVKVYHANDEIRCKEFVEKRGLIISHDTAFLGVGMYFWDNVFNAAKWRDKKERDLKGEARIVFARINIEEMLDLTDKDITDRIQTAWKNYLNKTNSPLKSNGRQKLGLALDVLPGIKDIPVRKANLKYNKGKNPLPIFYHGVKNVCSISTTNKVMYMVKDESKILERDYFESLEVYK